MYMDVFLLTVVSWGYWLPGLHTAFCWIQSHETAFSTSTSLPELQKFRIVHCKIITGPKVTTKLSESHHDLLGSIVKVIRNMITVQQVLGRITWNLQHETMATKMPSIQMFSIYEIAISSFFLPYLQCLCLDHCHLKMVALELVTSFRISELLFVKYWLLSYQKTVIVVW